MHPQESPLGPDADPFSQWLDDYRRGVDAALSRSEPPASALARDAQEAFQNWWRAEHEELLPREAAARLADPDLSAAEQDRLLPPDWPAQVERLAYEKAALQRRLDEAEAAKLSARERAGALEKTVADADARASQERGKLEDRLSDLARRLEAAESESASLRELKKALDGGATRLSSELERLGKELDLEREKGLLASRQGAELAKRVEELERERSRLRETVARQAGSLEELRKQASGTQARLVEAKELTDADVALMRQDLKLFMEELKIIRNTIKKGE